MKHYYTGLSLLELREKYGTGESGFYDNKWWLEEDFAEETPEKGWYNIDFSQKLTNKTWDEQLEEVDGEPLHPAVLAEAVLEHHAKTGERLLENWYSRTTSVTAGGRRVGLGYFGRSGLRVNLCWGDHRGGDVGLAASRKNPETSKLETLEPSHITLNGKQYRLIEE